MASQPETPKSETAYMSACERRSIIQSVITPNLIADIDEFITSSKSFRVYGNRLELFGKVSIAFSTVASFTTASIELSPYIRALPGLFSAFSMASFMLSGYCASESRERISQLNMALKNCGLPPLNLNTLVSIENSESPEP